MIKLKQNYRIQSIFSKPSVTTDTCEAFSRFDSELAAANLDLVPILESIKAREDEGDTSPYPMDIVTKLNDIVKLMPADFELLKMLHESFTADTDNGESDGGWPVCIWRCLKVPSDSAGGGWMEPSKCIYIYTHGLFWVS